MKWNLRTKIKIYGNDQGDVVVDVEGIRFKYKLDEWKSYERKGIDSNGEVERQPGKGIQSGRKNDR
jgi:hypothetical protein